MRRGREGYRVRRGTERVEERQKQKRQKGGVTKVQRVSVGGFVGAAPRQTHILVVMGVGVWVYVCVSGRHIPAWGGSKSRETRGVRSCKDGTLIGTVEMMEPPFFIGAHPDLPDDYTNVTPL